ncbi:hypothetical protein [Vibrio vulnificus]|uniref:hypothetical protein n=1 Tax=Vibrio vulnificus TaxID=672 RepID=UPI0007212ACE|nr:hypothetical protein [Vibrio vulnificus]ALM70798.1 hypothetical protein FORC9_1281 [Vibrio vulnificus]ANH63395.1 hypothetical protein FORC16_1512 [Vibrio vulnificus]
MKEEKLNTILKLVAPESVEVELVPLSTIEKSEFLYFWVTIFLSVWSALFGTWLSLLITDHQNKQVITVIGIFIIFITLVVVAFAYFAFKTRSTVRKNANNRINSVVENQIDKVARLKRVATSIAIALPEKFEKKDFYALMKTIDEDDDGDESYIDYVFSYGVNHLFHKDESEDKVYYSLKNT